MPVLQMVCDGAAEDAPLGAQCREIHQAEPLQRRSGFPTALWSGEMAEQAADRPSGEKLPVEVEPDATEPPARVPDATSMAAKSTSTKNR
jgi:hypothetical protein